MSELAISFRNVAKVFTRGQRVTAISDLSFDVQRGAYVCIVGRTGCGKSTTVNLLLGIEPPSGGSVAVLGLDPFRQFDALRGKIGCIFQGDRLLPWRNAIDNVRVPIEIIGKNERELNPGPQQLLQRLGLNGFETAFPNQLSGGMRQRVAIARALASDPDILLADEAFGHLDEVTGGKLRAEFKQLVKETGKTVVHITHSIDEAIQLSDRSLVFGRPGHVARQFMLDGKRTGPQRDRWREEIFGVIEASDLAGVGGAIAA
jgi:NitT/TauT family transport system ATP-binding protein